MKRLVASCVLLVCAGSCRHGSEGSKTVGQATLVSAPPVAVGFAERATPTDDRYVLMLGTAQGVRSVALEGEPATEATLVATRGDRKIFRTDAPVAVSDGLVITVAATDEQGQKTTHRVRFEKPGGGSGTPPPSGKVDIAWVRALLEREPIATMDAFLAKLPEDYRAYYTLMHTSRSLQGASGADPRVIMFGPDATLVMAFNGHPDHAAYDVLELIQWNEAERRYEFYEATFPERAGERATLSGHNPNGKCSTCHGGESLRPNWEPYFQWPGAYGEEDDGTVVGSDEERYIAAFKTSHATKDRYKHLVNVDGHFKYRATLTSRLEPGKDHVIYTSHTNRALTTLFYEQNVKRIAKLLYDQPTYQKNKFLIAGMLTDCLPAARLGRDGAAHKITDEIAALIAKEPLVGRYRDLTFASNARGVPDFIRPRDLAGRLAHANQELALGLAIDLGNWTLSTAGSIKAEGEAFKPNNAFDHAGRTPDPQGEASTLYNVVAELAALDPAFAGFDAFLCPDPGNTVLMTTTRENGQDKQVEIAGKSLCLAKDLAKRRAELTQRFGFYADDGLKMTCKLLAKRWLE